MIMFEIKQACKLKTPAKVLFYGVPGSGKTFSALRFARGLVSDYHKICFIDTERSCTKIANEERNFCYIDIDTFDYKTYMEAIQYASSPQFGFECIIVDSLTPLWSWEGGWCDMHSELSNTSLFKKNAMLAWGPINKEIRSFIKNIHQLNIHFIATIRSKPAFMEEMDAMGKKRIVKVGEGLDFKNNIEYEFDLAFECTQEDNTSVCRKDRSSIFQGMNQKVINEKDGEIFLSWCNKEIDASRVNEKYINNMADFLITHGKLDIEKKQAVFTAKGSKLIKMVHRLEEMVKEAKMEMESEKSLESDTSEIVAITEDHASDYND